MLRFGTLVVLLAVAVPAAAQPPKLPYPQATVEAWAKAGARPAVMVIESEQTASRQ